MLIEKIGMRAVAALISFILMLIFILPITHRIVNIGNIFGIMVTAALTVIFTFYAGFSGAVKHICESRSGRTAVCVCGVLMAAGVLYFAVLSGFMISAQRDAPKTENTTLVVLGCKVKNGVPSRMLKRRLDSAYGYLSEHEDVRVVVSGGKGSDESVSEAQCMRDYLVSLGISEDRIFMEDKSTDTAENLRFSKRIISENGLPESITLVTDGFHQLRAELIAKRCGFEDISNISAPTSWWLLPTYWVREWFGLSYFFVSGG